jgi:hypothetical protein
VEVFVLAFDLYICLVCAVALIGGLQMRPAACSARVHKPGPSARCNWGLPQRHVRLRVRRRVRRLGDIVDTIRRKGQSPRPGNGAL